jgi:AmpD protein
MMPPDTEAPDGVLWREGWYGFARRLDSPNFGPRPPGMPIDLVVVHSISLPPGHYGTQQVQALFTNTLDFDADPYFQTIRGLQVSAHFFIDRLGVLWQFVSVAQRAWHAGASSLDGRGNCNDFSVGVELEGLEGEPFEAAQYETLGDLCAALVQHYPVNRMVGHEHIAPGRKLDPGAGFEWTRLAHALGWPRQCFPSENPPSPAA